MKKAVPLLILVLVFAGCLNTRQSVPPGRSGLELIYLTDLSKVAANPAELGALLEEEKPLLVVDDPGLSSLDDLAWWEGEREMSMLQAMGCDLFFPPPEWILLGPERLYDLSSRAEFFAVALDLVDAQNNYPLSRYMIRQHSPYRLAFSAAAAESNYDRIFNGLSKLPIDSIFPVTASLLGLQTDFFIFFSDEDSFPKSSGSTYVFPRGGDNRVMDFRFISLVEFKLRETPFRFQPSADKGTWQARMDSLDAEVLGVSDTPLTSDSLQALALETLRHLAEEASSLEYVGVLIPEGFIKGEAPAGEITLGKMREIMEPEIFFLVSAVDLPERFSSGTFFAWGEIEAALLPASLCLEDEHFKARPLGLTGITSAQVARNMFPHSTPIRNTPPSNAPSGTPEEEP
jgi:hypothetical protein